MGKYTKKRFVPKKRVVRRKAPTLAKLAKQVAVLTKKQTQLTERDQFSLEEAIDAVSPYVARNLCNYSSWFKLWPSTSTPMGNVKSKMYHRYFKIDNLVTLDNINNEEGTVGFTYFIVSRRDTAGSATDTVNTLSLALNTDYIDNAGMTYMNLKKWKIHYVKRFTLTQGDIDTADASAIQRRFTATVKVNAKVENPDGRWNILENSPDPSDTYYAVLFNNNSAADLESPRWTFQCLHSVDN